MLIYEYHSTRADGRRLQHIYSDEGKQIRLVGTDIFYDDVIDFEDTERRYEEIDDGGDTND